MSGIGILFMVMICSVVWGGFLLLLSWMVTIERNKARAAQAESDRR